ncbi:MAG: sugar ABC transporter permease [Anaerolineae bacterium]|nr:sugar ABC transporter permease [Candidatus Roseilinea sp.]MDW8450145.1 sugar ABC transporter permease [Anaerolineae bacterium]
MALRRAWSVYHTRRNARLAMQDSMQYLKAKATVATRQKGHRAHIGSWLGLTVALCLLIYYLIVFVVPFSIAVWLSFHNWDFIVDPKFVGLRNYQRMFNDGYFWQAVRVTVTFSAVEISIAIAIGLVLAFLLSRLRGIAQRSILALFYLPVIIPSVVSVLLWRWLYISNGGAFNVLLTSLGLPPQPFLLSSEQALYCIIVMVIWTFLGSVMVLFLAGINEIPEHLIEAAMLDGAGLWRQFWYIILPLLRPVIVYQVVVSVIGTFQLFEQFVFLSGPGFSTRTLAVYTYQLGFQSLDLGYGAAVSMFIFVALLIATAVQLRRLHATFEY